MIVVVSVVVARTGRSLRGKIASPGGQGGSGDLFAAGRTHRLAAAVCKVCTTTRERNEREPEREPKVVLPPLAPPLSALASINYHIVEGELNDDPVDLFIYLLFHGPFAPE